MTGYATKIVYAVNNAPECPIRGFLYRNGTICHIANKNPK